MEQSKAIRIVKVVTSTIGIIGFLTMIILIITNWENRWMILVNGTICLFGAIIIAGVVLVSNKKIADALPKASSNSTYTSFSQTGDSLYKSRTCDSCKNYRFDPGSPSLASCGAKAFHAVYPYKQACSQYDGKW